MVAGLGFEPKASRSERDVLPLHHPAKGRRNGQRDENRYVVVKVFRYQVDTRDDRN